MNLVEQKMRSILQRNISAQYFWMLLGALHLFYFILAIFQGNYLLADSAEYIQEAQNIRDQFYFYCADTSASLNPDLLTKRTPLYPSFLAAILTLFKSPQIPVALLQGIFSLVNFYLLIQLLKEFKINIHYLFLFILILFTPAQGIYSNMVMSEILFQSSILFCFFYFVKYHRHKSKKALLFYTLSIIFAALIKPVFYLFVIVNVLFSLYYWWKKQDFKPLLFSLIPVCFVLLYSGWNQQRTGYFHYSSIQKINALNYNTYYFLMQQEGSAVAEEKVDAIQLAAKNIPDYKTQSKYVSQETQKILFKNLFPYTVYHLKGVSQFFLDPGRFDLANFFGVEKDSKQGMLQTKNEGGWKGILQKLKAQPIFLLLALGIVFFFNLIKLLGLLSFIRQKKIDPMLAWFCLILIGYLAFLTGPLGASRFALPVFILVLFCVMIGLGERLLLRSKPIT